MSWRKEPPPPTAAINSRQVSISEAGGASSLVITHDFAVFVKISQKPVVREDILDTAAIFGLPLQHLANEAQEQFLLLPVQPFL